MANVQGDSGAATDIDLVFVSQGDKLVKEWFGNNSRSSSSASNATLDAAKEHLSEEDRKEFEHQQAEQKRQLDKLHQQLRDRHGRQGLGSSGKSQKQQTADGRAPESSAQLQMLQRRLKYDSRKRGLQGEYKSLHSTNMNSRTSHGGNNDDSSSDSDSEEDSRYTAISHRVSVGSSTAKAKDTDDLKAALIQEERRKTTAKKRKH
eukprot:gb/GECG01003079.1/.p1 GENE.gb/GECG01003079.1/~~gb/GECG01003079.1/.p1  ORF type:complete len:205 (+),score=39.93 gb/GECG01003079.1/:1-615(+)